VADSLAPGSIIRERYQIESLIGQGGMGAVYRVADLRLPGRACALKVLQTQPHSPFGGPASAAGRQQFLLEASTLARLDHPNLPKVSDYFALEEYDCLVMDYVAGQDLQQCVQEARRQGRFLPLDQVLGWMDQLCDVLTYLHTQQPPVVHGDVKPANIKLTATGQVKLVDFGLARPADSDDPRTLTGSGLRAVGSLPYAALEQYAGPGGHVDARTDLYGLGATLYHLLTNQPPASAHARFLDPAALVPARQINPALPTAVEDAITAALQPHPSARPASVAAWHALLTAASPQGTGRESPRPSVAVLDSSAVARAPASVWTPWFENRWYVLVALLLVLAALALTFWR
jgi:eukaryotic-like serine/threonine-protein kinase